MSDLKDAIATHAKGQDEHLSTHSRAKLPSRDFAGKGRSYPVENKAHARAAEMDAGIEARRGKISEGEKDRIDRKADRVLRGKRP